MSYLACKLHKTWFLNDLEAVAFGPSPASTTQRLAWIFLFDGGGIGMHNLSWLNANIVSLQKAMLCANCEAISDGCNGHCVACGSQALLNLSRLLGGAIDYADMSFEGFAGERQKQQYLSAVA